MYRLRVLALFLLLGAPAAKATSIVAVFLGSEVYVAADSKQVTVDPADPSHSAVEDVCKITTSQSRVFAYSGKVAGYFRTGFDPERIRDATLWSVPDFQEALRALENRLGESLLIALKDIGSSDPAYFERYLAGEEVFQCLVAAPTKNGPALTVLGFCALGGPTRPQVTVQHEQCPSTSCRVPYVIRLGHHEYIDIALNDSSIQWAPSLVENLTALVAIEAAGSDDTVGLPVDILCVSAAGPTWMVVKPSCR
jgi:hypothetical protein